jgi:hypothetical protein
MRYFVLFGVRLHPVKHVLLILYYPRGNKARHLPVVHLFQLTIRVALLQTQTLAERFLLILYYPRGNKARYLPVVHLFQLTIRVAFLQAQTLAEHLLVVVVQ